jgi:serine/threonine protein kinase
VGMLKDELLALRHLKHPNVVQLYGVSIDDLSYVALLLELAPFGSLRNLLDTKGADVVDSPQAQLKLLRGVAAGMAYLHNRKIHHHDLKTDNILVFPSRSSETTRNSSNAPEAPWSAKLSDFGLAVGASGRTMASQARTTAKGGGSTRAAAGILVPAALLVRCSVVLVRT